MSLALRTHAYATLGDEALVRRARAKDTLAFDVLVARHRDRLYGLALDSLGTPQAAADALCDGALSALDDLDSACAVRTPRAWLYLHGLRAVFRRLGIPASGLALEHVPGGSRGA